MYMSPFESKIKLVYIVWNILMPLICDFFKNSFTIYLINVTLGFSKTTCIDTLQVPDK